MSDKITELKEDIARRLRPLMAGIPEEEFERLVAQMAEIQHRYEARAHSHFARGEAQMPRRPSHGSDSL